MTRFAFALSAALCAAFAAQAQTPTGAAEGKSSAREERRQNMRAARQKAASKMRSRHQQAVETCKSAQPDKRRDCMRHELCAHAKDPVQCEARAKQRAERRKSAKPSS